MPLVGAAVADNALSAEALLLWYSSTITHAACVCLLCPPCAEGDYVMIVVQEAPNA